MTGLDTTALRQALRAAHDEPHGHGGDPVDVARIMVRGRRLRTRRRLAAVAGGACAVAILAGTATAIANLTAAPPAPGQPASPGQHGPAQPGLGQPSLGQPSLGGHSLGQRRPPGPGPSQYGTPLPVMRPATARPVTPPSAEVKPTPTALPSRASGPAPATSPVPSSAVTPAVTTLPPTSGTPVATASSRPIASR